MTSANPNINTLKELIALEERRASLQGELNTVEQRVSSLRNSLLSGSPAKAASAAGSSPRAKAAVSSPPRKGGTYRDYIMAALEAAGEAGVRVKDIALSMKTKPVNIHSWFHSNLKRIPSIKKITGGHYRIAGGAKVSVSPAPAKAAPAPKPAKAPRRRRTKPVKRGTLTAAILEHLKAAGSGGVKIADLADKLGAKYKNVYIWFATTGKKNYPIKRIAPATYQLQ
ncbi:MAG: hypothetical protein ABIZ56_01520 [Chthoniobacteraceae bacterium]